MSVYYFPFKATWFDFCLSESLNWDSWSDDDDFPNNITDVFQATFFYVKEDGQNI